MADINIEKKSPTTWIWWVLGLVILGLLLFWLLTPGTRDQVALVDDDPAAETMPATAPPTAAPAGAAMVVQEYRERCAPQQPGQMALDHQHTAECLRRLADAIQTSVRQQPQAQADPHLQNARQVADQLEASPADAANHSQMTRDGFQSITTAFQEMQAEMRMGLDAEIQRLQQTAESVDPGTPMLDQRQRVQDFFNQAGNVLDRMTQTGA
jgi:hypothetical protein